MLSHKGVLAIDRSAGIQGRWPTLRRHLTLTIGNARPQEEKNFWARDGARERPPRAEQVTYSTYKAQDLRRILAQIARDRTI